MLILDMSLDLMGVNFFNTHQIMSSSVYLDNKTKDILIIGKGPTQGLDDTRMTTEAECSINYGKQRKKFCLSLHYNGSNRNFLLMG